MQFFDGLRPEVFVQGAKLRRDKKTGRRMWGITLIVTFGAEHAKVCGPQIEANYAHIAQLEHGTDEIVLNTIIEGCAAKFFALVDDADPALVLEAADLDLFRLTRDGKVVELWFFFELENYDELHAWVKKFAYTRVYAQFKPPADLAGPN